MTIEFNAFGRTAQTTGAAGQKSADTINARLDEIREKHKKRLEHIRQQQAAEQAQINKLLGK